jgi:hypothetical protein
MVSDSDMGTEQEESDMEEESSEHEMPERESMGSGGMEGSSQGESSGQEMGAQSSTKAKPGKAGGRRAALRILRENVDSVSKDLASFRKAHEVNSKRLEKQVTTLHNEVTSLKSFISKENARAKGKQEVLLNRIITKMNEKKPRPAAASKPAKKAPAKKSKGKK